MNIPIAEGDGYGFETLFLGCSYKSVDPKHRRGKCLRFRNALRQAMVIQQQLGCDPFHPKTKLAQEIFDYIEDRLHSAGHQGTLQFFICVGTHLDRLGVDCFFRFNSRIVTIDLYSGKLGGKAKKNKADVVLSRAHFLKDEHLKVAEDIARRLIG